MAKKPRSTDRHLVAVAALNERAKEIEIADVPMDEMGLPCDRRYRSAALAMLDFIRRFDGGRGPNDCVEAGRKRLHKPRVIPRHDALVDRSPKAIRAWERKCEADYDRSFLAGSEAQAVFNALKKSHRIVEGARGQPVLGPIPGRSDPSTKEGRQSNYAATVDRVAGKTTVTEEGRRRMADLYRMIGVANRYARVPFGDGRAVLIPTGFEVDASGVRLTSAALVVATPGTKLRCLEAGADAISGGLAGIDEMEIGIVPEACRPLHALENNLGSLELNPKASRASASSIFPADADKLRQRGFETCIMSARSGIESFVGEKLTEKAWKSLSMSLRRRGLKRHIVRFLVISILEPEVRKACSRDPWATADLYNWFQAGDPTSRLRRLQASDAYPVMTMHFAPSRRLTHVIDSGAPLAPAISAHMGYPPEAIRHLRGLHWQRLSEGNALQNSGMMAGMMNILPILVADDHPKTKKDWARIKDCADALRHRLGDGPLPANVAHGLRRLDSIEKLKPRNIFDAVGDLALTLFSIGIGSFDRAPQSHNAINDLRKRTLSLLMGENGGVKRVTEFSNDWHRGVHRRNAAIRALEAAAREVANEAERAISDPVERPQLIHRMKSWASLTPEPFTSGEGTIAWLCDEQALADEGMTMQHCVGTYDRVCFLQDVHIGAVSDGHGGRSTVEFRIEHSKDGKKSLVLIQHYGARNKNPAPGCRVVVDAFIDRAKSDDAFLDHGRLHEERRARLLERYSEEAVNEWEKSGRIFDGDERHRGYAPVPMDENSQRRMLALYADCLPSNLTITLEDCRAIASAVTEIDAEAAHRAGLDYGMDEAA